MLVFYPQKDSDIVGLGVRFDYYFFESPNTIIQASQMTGDKESAHNARDPGSIPGSGRSPGDENGHPFQHSCLRNPTDRRACQAIVHRVIRVWHDLVTHSSTLAWKIPWAEEPGRLQSMGSRKVGRDWATSLSLFTSMHWRRKWQPTPVFLPGKFHGQKSLVGYSPWGRKVQLRLKWRRYHHFMGNRWGNSGNSVRLHIWGLQNHCRWWL